MDNSKEFSHDLKAFTAKINRRLAAVRKAKAQAAKKGSPLAEPVGDCLEIARTQEALAQLAIELGCAGV